MKKIYCISFSYIEDFNLATCIIVEMYYGIDYDNYILEFDTEKDADVFLQLLEIKEIEEYDIFESEKITNI